ncbi:phosphohistidine phosphatase SixA [Patescibacteria group bacterium]
MKIYLVQHGNQLTEDVDPQEGLSDKGRSDCEKVASYAAKEGIKVDAMFHSVKLRAKQTAEIFAKHLLPEGQLEEKEGLKPMDDVTIWVDQLQDGLMLVGHLPFMQKLSSLLLTGNAEKPVITFQQGGIVCLKKDKDGNWSVRFMVTPNLSST